MDEFMEYFEGEFCKVAEGLDIIADCFMYAAPAGLDPETANLMKKKDIVEIVTKALLFMFAMEGWLDCHATYGERLESKGRRERILKVRKEIPPEPEPKPEPPPEQGEFEQDPLS